MYSGLTNSALAITSPTQSDGTAELPFVQNSANWGGNLTITRQSDGGYAISYLMVEKSNLGLNAIPVQLTFPVGSRTNQTGNPAVHEYTAGSGSQDAELRVDLASSSSGRRYVNFALLIVCNAPGGTGCAPDQQSASQFVFGSPTPTGEIPLSGSASYSGLFSAPAKTGNDIIDGLIGLQVDFAGGGISGRLSDVNIAVDVGLSGAVSKVPDFLLSGNLGSNGLLSGSLTPGAGSAFKGGSWAANFFGPNVAEVGGTIQLIMGPGGIDPYFAGTFSAAKQ